MLWLRAEVDHRAVAECIVRVVDVVDQMVDGSIGCVVVAIKRQPVIADLYLDQWHQVSIIKAAGFHRRHINMVSPLTVEIMRQTIIVVISPFRIHSKATFNRWQHVCLTIYFPFCDSWPFDVMTDQICFVIVGVIISAVFAYHFIPIPMPHHSHYYYHYYGSSGTTTPQHVYYDYRNSTEPTRYEPILYNYKAPTSNSTTSPNSSEEDAPIEAINANDYIIAGKFVIGIISNWHFNRAPISN